MNRYNFIEADIVDMATLPKVLLPRATRSNSSNRTGPLLVNRSKHTNKVFSLDPNSGLSSYHTTKSDFWVEEDVDLSKLDPKKYCYVEIERFIGKINGCEVGPVALLSCAKKLGGLVSATKAKGINVPTIIGIKNGSTLNKAKASKVLDFKTFFTNALKEVEAQTNCGEISYADEIFSKFAGKNVCLRGELRKHAKVDQAPNTHRLVEEIFDLEATDKGSTIKSCVDSICAHIKIESESVRSKRSAKLDAMEVKANKVSHAMRLLQAVDSYNLMSYRSNYKEYIEACVDYIVTRDHLLAGV